MSDATWTCPHGVDFNGSDEFISGARMAHDELEARIRHLEDELRSGLEAGRAQRIRQLEEANKEWARQILVASNHSDRYDRLRALDELADGVTADDVEVALAPTTDPVGEER